MKNEEKRDMGTTMRRVWEHLSAILGDGEGRYVSYNKIAKEIGRSRHAISYSIERLRARGVLRILDGKMYLLKLYSA